MSVTTPVQTIQKILFGPPGSGKSFRARQIARDLGIAEESKKCCIEVTFHPEYGYGDFMAKLLPMTVQRTKTYQVKEGEGGTLWNATGLPESSIEYQIHPGHLIHALAQAINNPKSNVLLIIDEINRGNCAAIFGDAFQLLDREPSGWSGYGVNLSPLHYAALQQSLSGLASDSWNMETWIEITYPKESRPKEIDHLFGGHAVLHLPPNLSILGTMNTSDESVYYMDTAFKMRWEFEYLPWNFVADESEEVDTQRKAWIQDAPDGRDSSIQQEYRWGEFLTKLNGFIAKASPDGRLDDKQIGLWFCRCKKTDEVAIGKDKNYYLELLVYLGNLKNKYLCADWSSVLSDLGVQVECHGDNVKIAGIGKTLKAVSAALKKKYVIEKRTTTFLVDGIFDCINDKDSKDSWEQALNTLKANKQYESWLNNGDVVLTVTEIGNGFVKPGAVADFFYRVIERCLKSNMPYPHISKASISNKLMHFLWDNVFSRDKAPLAKKLFGSSGGNDRLLTFADFTAHTDLFIAAVMEDADRIKQLRDSVPA